MSTNVPPRDKTKGASSVLQEDSAESISSRTSPHLLASQIRNGTMTKSLSMPQAIDLVDVLKGHVSSRKLYLKVACLAVLKYDSDGEPLTPAEVSFRSKKYTSKNCTMSPRTCASVLAMLSRIGIVGRTQGKPFYYWWHQNV